jgi:hypothetical protein
VLLGGSLVLLAGAGLPLSGCGDARTAVPSLNQPAAAEHLRTLRYPAAGLQFRAPSNWATVNERRPRVAVVSSGPAIVAIWRYPRTHGLPTDVHALRRARAALVAAIRAHDPTFHLIHSRILVVGGDPAVEVNALEKIGGQLRRVRSTHVYAFGGEVVLDEYAPPGEFGPVDRDVFSPLKQSLLLSPTS